MKDLAELSPYMGIYYLTITHLLIRSNRDMNINIFGLSATLVTLFFIIISR